MKKGLFIVNPSSGRQNFTDKLREIVGTLILRQICNTIDIYYTEKKDDAIRRTSELKEGEYDFVVAVGGDGTLNEVVNGVVKSGSGIPIALLSTGTVNDFGSYLNLPQDTRDFCRMIKDFELHGVDVGQVNDKYFINVVAAGMMSDIGFRVPKEQKAAFGKMAYYLEGAADIPNQLGNVFHMQFVTADTVVDEEVRLFMVANSRSVGGFKDIAPQASVSDGLFDVIIFKKMDLFQMFPLLFAVLSGDHVNHPMVEYLQTDKIHITNLSGQEIAVDYDGEYLDGGFPLEISLHPKEVNFLVPKKEEE
ncbi:MAG: diacylglycerol kinase family lipid kinase [Eubacterium sp.]|nr:diacylglycerol kinase family lipid kinase [Eubacterium sp.]